MVDDAGEGLSGFLPEAAKGSPAADYCWPTDGRADW